jgi:hypothetical protein
MSTARQRGSLDIFGVAFVIVTLRGTADRKFSEKMPKTLCICTLEGPKIVLFPKIILRAIREQVIGRKPDTLFKSY